MNTQIRSLADIFAFNALSLKVGLSDVSNEQAGRRWRDGDGSSIAFLVGHLLSSRYGMLKRLGKVDDNPYAPLFSASTGPRDISEYPPLAELAKAWDEAAPRLESAIRSVSDEDLEVPAEGFPAADKTTRGLLMFLAWHESYHVGQIGLMRTEMGLPSVQSRIHEAMQR